jgi:aminobenzoyl-glutamate utilization protein B
VPGVAYHHWAGGAALATSIAHKGAVAGAKVLANAALECLRDPGVVARAKDSFARELDGEKWFSMLPAEQKPPVDLNRRAMDAFRPAMREHYVKERPRFA